MSENTASHAGSATAATSRHIACDVAIVGSGPAGLSAAIRLREHGVGRVVVVERESEAGGIPRHCAHPPYGVREYHRLMTGPTYARHNVKLALAAGVEILTRHTVVALDAGARLKLTTPDGLATLTARRVLLAVGARETPRSARRISGDRPLGVVNTGTLQASLFLEHRKPFEQPLIVGTELVSLSAIASCRKAGIEPVAMIEPRGRPTARWPLNLYPRLNGIPLYVNTRLVSIEGSDRVEAAWVQSGRSGPRRIDCDGVLLTGEFTPESALVRQSALMLDPRSQGPSVDPYGRCSDPSYFAAGNLLRPIETAGWSWREGRRVADNLATDLADGLAQEECVTINLRDPIKYCVPQRVPVSNTDRDGRLQLRVTQPVKGSLRLWVGERVVWQSTGHFLPERRILIPSHTLPTHLDGPVKVDLI
ncbi:NAD(P)/FAD-dependent oxidoreductase [Salinicola rhizosphaerae]|uniref:FAD/NAD(P)-binding domain-containing protein n=1 Tax=Salinicola rhizosphaerae TaxID=1443141 RepID=A0ABQ3E0Z6_9GAMM|nr:FAD-dependent oxidoreductase [Salinicola rhizosphaerae]GHB21497.1 hypothetical protein GCM10009038_20440 [Salinicola rhizosphaerae]